MGYRAGQHINDGATTYGYGDLVPDAASWPTLYDCVLTGLLIPDTPEDIPALIPTFGVEARMVTLASDMQRAGQPVPAGLVPLMGAAGPTSAPEKAQKGAQKAPQRPSEAPQAALEADPAPEAPEAPKAAPKRRKATTAPEATSEEG